MTVKTAPDRAQWLRLLGIALLIGTLVTTLEILTRERIVASQTSAALDYLRQVLGPDDQGAAITFENWPIPNRQLGLLGLSEGDEMHIALRAGQPIAAIVPSISNAGYGGAIQLLVGIDFTGRIIAVRVISHRETVGLGDKIEIAKSDWIEAFSKRSLSDPDPKYWAVKADGGIYDQFTGATITPRAVVNQVAATLQFFADERAALAARGTSQANPEARE
tara:strand:+ start:402 stop:1061 length:660 start_codon:yes stop_codon:yes gene_type:complete